MRSENNARILYTVERGFILQSKGGHFEKNSLLHYAQRNYFQQHFAWHSMGLYTSDLLPTPMLPQPMSPLCDLNLAMYQPNTLSIPRTSTPRYLLTHLHFSVLHPNLTETPSQPIIQPHLLVSLQSTTKSTMELNLGLQIVAELK